MGSSMVISSRRVRCDVSTVCVCHQDDFCLYNKGTDDYLDFDSQIAFSIDGVDAAPITLAESRLRPDADEWIASYDAEVRSLKERNTWTVKRWRNIPPGRRAIRCKLVFCGRR